MDGQLLLRSFHLFGAILWIGGVASVSMMAVAFAESVRQPALQAARGTIVRLVTPGLVLAWIGGLAVLLPNFTEVYARAGWMHAKLTLVLVASALTGVLTGSIRRAASGDAPLPEGKVKALGMATLFIGLLVVLLAKLRPF